jgi:hypothetical protein
MGIRMGATSAVCRRLVMAALIGTMAAALSSPPAALTAARVRKSDDVSPGPYLERLLDEINAGRARAGTTPLAYLGASANDAVGRYLSELTPLMLAAGTCFHGEGSTIRPGWDYVALADSIGEARGEVLACPSGGHYWTARAVADAWSDSLDHRRLLYDDPGIDAVACGAHGARPDGQAFRTVACVTYRR